MSSATLLLLLSVSDCYDRMTEFRTSLVLPFHVNASELIKEGNFESVRSVKTWFCQGNCTLSRDHDARSGNYSIKVSDRQYNYDGLAQNVAVSSGGRYKFSAYIKLLSLENGSLYQNVDTIMLCLDTNGKTQYISFGHSPYVQLATGWHHIGGITQVPTGDQFCHIYIQVNGTSIPWFPSGYGLEQYIDLKNYTSLSTVSYLVDDVSLTEVVSDSNWREEAEKRIDKLRKADLTISVVSVGTDNSRNTPLDIELIQMKHEFPFGSAVAAEAIVNASFSKYQRVFFDNFNWAVLENALKWRQLEKIRGQVDYHVPLEALKALKLKSIPVRGHNIFWGVWYMQQPWKLKLTRSQLILAMRDHLYGVIERTKGMLEHWDVNNENLHGDWYEQQTGNANITMDMFNDVSVLDPHPKLFLNDFGILGVSDSAMALKCQAKLFKEAKVPIHGVGIQSHLHSELLDIDMIKARLDLVAEAGLPIWITELTVFGRNVTRRAQCLDDLLTLYFSHPAVEGVMLWGFWDEKMYQGNNMSLFDGPDLTPNEAGDAYLKLYHHIWRTNQTYSLQGKQLLNLRAFKGDYQINISHDGKTVTSENFTLDLTGKVIEIHLNTSDTQQPVSAILVG